MMDTRYKLVKYEDNRSMDFGKKLYEARIKDALAIYNKHKEKFIYRACPICGSEKFIELSKFYETYDIAECCICKSNYVNPAPDIEALSDYYNNCNCNMVFDDIVSERNKKPKNFIMDTRVEKVINTIDNFLMDKKEIKILEVGCGSGKFLSKLKISLKEQNKEYKLRYTGIDIDSNVIDKNEDKDLNLKCVSVEEFAKSNTDSYDIVVHFELIEHLVSPYGFVVNIKKLLKKNGIMVFTTQNISGLEMSYLTYNSHRLMAHSIYPPMHLNAFSIKNMLHFAIRGGFGIHDIQTPGKMDVDLVCKSKDFVEDREGAEFLNSIDEETKGFIQYLLNKTCSSSSMMCVLYSL